MKLFNIDPNDEVRNINISVKVFIGFYIDPNDEVRNIKITVKVFNGFNIDPYAIKKH
jgi:hypothetical protein